MKLNWIEVGNLDAEECIVFLHEGLGCVEMWKDYPENLCQSLNVRGIVYDRSGYGKSNGSLVNRKSDYLHLAAEELTHFIEFLKLEKVHLYGHSDGGSIALICAGTKPELVKTVVTEAAHVFNEQETIDGVLAARPLLKEGKMDGLKKYHGERYEEVFYAWNDIWLDDSFKNWNIEDITSRITCPGLIIQGLDDQYGTLKQVEAICKTNPQNVRSFTPKNCGHAPFKEKTNEVLKKVTEFYHEQF